MTYGTDSRNTALELVDNGMVSAEEMLTMCLKYMSTDEVSDMLDTNELSERFNEDADEYEDDEPDVDYRQELFDAFGEDC